MSPFDVHINRNPITGKVTYYKYHKVKKEIEDNYFIKAFSFSFNCRFSVSNISLNSVKILSFSCKS